jgi:hypothetical protein
MINNYQGFLLWCKNNNFSLLQFKKTLANQREFCKFIEKNYKTTSMIEGIYNAEGFLTNIQKNRRVKMTNANLNYTLMNLRMSICELG